MSFKLVKSIAGNTVNAVRERVGLKKAKVNEEKTLKPMGFRIGAAVELDSLDWRLMESMAVFKFPGGTHIISAHGVINLHGDTRVHRFYTNDGIFFQVVESGGEVEEARIFSPHDSVFPVSEEDWAFWLKDDPMIGQVNFELKDGTEFHRAWFEDEKETVGPVELEETIAYNNDGDAIVVEHKAMQYGRWLDDNTIEWLLVQAEDRGEEASVELYVGSDLDESDFEVI